MFNAIIKPNTIVRIGTIIGVVEGQDIYRTNTLNVYNNTTRRLFPINEISQIISEEFVDKELFAFQVYNLIK